MTEFVELRMQEMLPVLEKIKQTSLLKPNELMKLVGDMKEQEFKIQRPGRSLDDFIKYFNLLRTVLLTLKKKREKLGYFHNVNEIENKIRGIITSRFGMARRNFQLDLQFWHFQIEYLMKLNWYELVSDVYTEVTKLHGVKRPELWIEASNFEWNWKPGKGIENARRVVQLGLRHHPSLLRLYVQGFTLELRYVNHARSSPKLQNVLLETENGKAILEDLILAKAIYKSAKGNCSSDGPNIYLEFYKAATQFDFTKTFRDEIRDELIEDYIDNELAWDVCARITMAETQGNVVKLTESAITSAMNVYEEGLKVKPTMKMYDYFVTTLQLLESKVFDSEMKFKLIHRQLDVFQRAHAHLKLSEKNYLSWYKMLSNAEDNGITLPTSASLTLTSAKEILGVGLAKFPNNPQLLAEHVKLELKLFEDNRSKSLKSKPGGLRNLLENISEPLAKIQRDELWIWTYAFVYLANSDDSTPKILTKFINSSPLDIRANLKCLYLKHLSLTNLDKARSFYKKQVLLPGNSVQFHLDMIRIEILTLGSYEESRKDILQRVKFCYENGVRDYGRQNIELWLQYLKFGRTFQNDIGVKNGIDNASSIYARALQTLDVSRREDFINAERKMSKSESNGNGMF